MDEEKTVDEAVEEKAEEIKEFEPVAFEDAIKEEPAKESAPVLRDADEPDPADMIHKHVDNFLAKIAGETPIDETVRDSTEYWLNKIAESGGGGEDNTHIYLHKLWFVASNNRVTGNAFIYSTDNTPFTQSTIKALLGQYSFGGASNYLPYHGTYLQTQTEISFIYGINIPSNVTGDFKFVGVTFNTSTNTASAFSETAYFSTDTVIQIN